MAEKTSIDGFEGTWNGRWGWFVHPTARFKTVTISAFWIRDLTPQGRALGALLPFVLKRGTARWPSRRLIETRLEDLYGAAFRADVGKVGDKQILTFQISVIHGQFLPGQPDTVSQALDFLAEVLGHPYWVDGQFADAVVEQEKALLQRQIAAVINDKGQYALNRLLAEMAEGRAFGLLKWGTQEEVQALTAQQLTAFYDQMVNQAPMAVIVVGDVEPDTIGREIRQRWNASRSRQPVNPIEPYQLQHRNRLVVDREEVSQGKLNLGYATGICARDPQYPALVMYAGILGGFAHSKLFLNVRERASLAYYAYARIDPALALMVIGAGIEFSQYQAARAIIEEQVQAMAAGEISDQELQFTERAYLNDLRSEQDSPGQLIGRQLERLLIGGGYTASELMRRLRDVSREEIVAVARQVSLDTVYFLTAKEAPELG